MRGGQGLSLLAVAAAGLSLISWPPLVSSASDVTRAWQQHPAKRRFPISPRSCIPGIDSASSADAGSGCGPIASRNATTRANAEHAFPRTDCWCQQLQNAISPTAPSSRCFKTKQRRRGQRPWCSSGTCSDTGRSTTRRASAAGHAAGKCSAARLSA